MGEDIARPRLSVIVPAFNAARTISQTLKSLQAQTMTDWEAIVVDDDSDDMTYNIARAFGERDPRIWAVRLPHNIGAAAAVNRGMQCASGRYYAVLAADDYWLEDFAEKTVSILDATVNVSGVYTDYIEWDEAAGIKRVHRVPVFDYDLLARGDFVNFSALVTRSPPWLDPKWNPVADWDCLLRLTKDRPLVRLARILAVRRFHSGQVSVQSNSAMIRKSFLLSFSNSPLKAIRRLCQALSWPILCQVRK